MKKTTKMHKFLPLTKVDVVKREVWGFLAEEAPDKSGEIFDYATSVPYFKAWNDQFSKSVPGDGIPSVGNLRAMHDKIAAGKFISMAYDDVSKKIFVGAKVIDDAEWAKCQSGVYTGFSIGGKYAKCWMDGEYMRYTAIPAEGSLVDNPCMYGADFTAVKSDGMADMIKFVGSIETVEKSLYDVQDLASCLSCLNSVRMWIKMESEYEEDNSPIPGKLKDLVGQLSQVLVELVQEETSELTAGEDEGAEKMEKAEINELKKSVDAQGQALNGITAALAELTKNLKPVTPVAEPPVADPVAKFTAVDDKLTKMQTSVDATAATVIQLSKAVEDVVSVLEAITKKAVPTAAAANGSAVAVTKEQDGDPVAPVTKSTDPLDTLKGIYAAGPVQLAGNSR